MSDFTFPENCKIVNGFTALGIGTAGAVYGVYVSLKLAHMAWAVINYRQGDGTQVVWGIRKASSIAGGDVLASTVLMPIWSNLACATSDLLVARTAAATYTLDVGQATKMVIFQVDPAALGVLAADGVTPFDCVQIWPVGGNIPITSAWACNWVIQPRYPSRVLTQPSIVVD